MKKMWKPVVAGICNIISTIIVGIFVTSFLACTTCAGPDNPRQPPGFGNEFIALVLFGVAYLALAGGFSAIQRNNWKLALAGSIAACFCSAPFGAAAVVLISMSKDEFKR
jgi:hypothetical protein